MEASSKTDLAAKLRERGYIPTLVKEKNETTRSASFLSSFGIVSGADKIMFAKNLGVMLSAGLPITRALEILSRQTNNKYFSRTIISLMNDARKGDSLSEAMKKFPKIFSKLFVAMVKTGEESGQLSESLNLAGRQMEKDYMLMRKVKGAMMYPAIILAAMVLIGIFMFIYVVPTLVATFKELNVDLPLSTQAIIFISDSITKHTYLFIIFSWLLFFSLAGFCGPKKGKYFWAMFFENPADFSHCQKNKFSQDQPDFGFAHFFRSQCGGSAYHHQRCPSKQKIQRSLDNSHRRCAERRSCFQLFQKRRKNLSDSFGGNDGGRRENGQNSGNAGENSRFLRRRNGRSDQKYVYRHRADSDDFYRRGRRLFRLVNDKTDVFYDERNMRKNFQFSIFNFQKENKKVFAD